MSSFLQDVRIAVRGYLAKPLFTIVVLVDSRPGDRRQQRDLQRGERRAAAPARLPARVGARQRVRSSIATTQRRRSISPPNYFDLKEQARSFAGVAAYWSPSVNLSGDGGDPEKVQAATCSYDLFGVLGVNADRRPRADGGRRRAGRARGGGPRPRVVEAPLRRRSRTSSDAT